MALRKIAQAAGSKGGEAAPLLDFQDWPGIVEYLTMTVYPDGQAREPSALIVVSDGSSWRVCLSDKDNGRTMWKTGVTLLDTLQAIEDGLREDDPTMWRQAAAKSPKGRKRS